MNPKFVFNLSLVAENQYSNKEYDKALKTLKNFKKANFIIGIELKRVPNNIKQKNKTKSRIHGFKFNNFKPNNKILFDVKFYKNLKNMKG